MIIRIVQCLSDKTHTAQAGQDNAMLYAWINKKLWQFRWGSWYTAGNSLFGTSIDETDTNLLDDYETQRCYIPAVVVDYQNGYQLDQVELTDDQAVLGIAVKNTYSSTSGMVNRNYWIYALMSKGKPLIQNGFLHEIHSINES
ncbi:hypothetical protein [Teredinibacter sp. KSP-S5-2]|uniref:hypothetical protein n=1 Tax=Teredinibacter sp. KSP-S5-2 TaxID=3034506 RepID=UPI0029342324|nr:hypothetical protein [Teredinibacter sp. KSP-S5-2]WNO10455.1 hypothetical protein P5V12_04650 [Teredinibacter sp. KSP-S5-2]